MRNDILEIITCPGCSGSGFEIQTFSEGELEIRDGELRCKTCQIRLGIRDGILDMLSGFESAIVKTEQEFSMTDHYTAKERATILTEKFVLGDTMEEPWPHFPRKADRDNFQGLLSFLDLKEADRVLDVGTGTCWSTSQLALRGCHAVAIDINRAPYTGLGAGSIHFSSRGVFFERVLQDMSKLNFREKAFDFIVANASVHHAENLKKTLSGFHHILKPGGKLAMGNEPVAGLYRQFFPSAQLLGSKEAGANENAYPLGHWRKTAEEVGFRFKFYLPNSAKEKLWPRKNGFEDYLLSLGPLKKAGEILIRECYRTLLLLRGGAPLMVLEKRV